MKTTKRSVLAVWLVIVLAWSAVLSSPVSAAYPEKGARIIVGFPPGGVTDSIARITAKILGDTFGQPFVVENRPGASGNIAHEMVARAPGDGYTLLFTSAPLAINPALYRNLPYDAVKDFKPITLVATVPSLLLVPANSRIEKFTDFVAFVKTNPGRLTYGSGGNGTPQHLAMEMLKSAANLRIVHIPYKGGAPAVTDLIGGQTDVMFAAFPEVVQHVNGGRLRALAISSPARSKVMPAVPTVAESGFPAFEAIGWQGLLAPASTPVEIVERINAAVAAGLAPVEMRNRIEAMGIEFSGAGPAAFQAFIAREVPKWAEVVGRSGARID
ncbi:MAG: tripartite tricarboxylate transporter substrate binding protein [Betaproteobacteria bacterium]